MYRPSATQSITDHVFWEPKMHRPLGDRHGATVPFDDAIRPAIVRLLNACCPAHVTRFVIAVIVDALDRMSSCWFRPHIVREGDKRFSPLIADGDSARSVSGETVGCRQMAAIIHAAPNSIRRRVRASVCGVALAEHVREETAAGLDTSSDKFAAPDGLLPSAIAGAFPPRTPIDAPGVCDNKQATIASADAIDQHGRCEAPAVCPLVRRALREPLASRGTQNIARNPYVFRDVLGWVYVYADY